MQTRWLLCAGVLCIAGVVRAAPYDPQATYDFDIPLTPPPFEAESGTGGPAYLIFGADVHDVTTGNDEAYYEEWSVPYDTSYQIDIDSILGDDPVILSDAGFDFSLSEFPLDDLPSLPYAPVPSLDGNLAPGGELSGVVSPEPASLGVIAVSAVALLRRRRV